ncbi:hypothetical protein UFOVP313_43 [uncultured Caudovirales phage]|uniref:Uncharacterized protein n=1 Tax=uncultured Caudovirales phage TaxID=2100421 RepID=A0A6J5LVI5_9CAUD|nr:hypothetical protein UFOVP313_43 [uncultured Caudovirales phage]
METEILDLDAAFEKAWESGQGEEVEPSEPVAPDEKNVASTEEPDEVESEADSQSEEPTVETQQDAEPLAAPVFWDEGTKEAFYKLDRAAQELVLSANKSSQADYTRKTQELAAKSREVEAINQAFEPYEADLAAQGANKAEVVDYMMRWNNLINRDPVRAIYKIAELTGVQLPGVSQQTGYEQSPVDPARTELEQRLARLEAERETVQFQQQADQLKVKLESIANEKDGTGSLVRPMFRDLLPAIQGLVPVIATENADKDLSELELVDLAYRRAYEPYKKLQKEQLTKQVQRSKTANLASSSISSSASGQSTSRPRIKSVDDAVDRAFEDLGM